MHTVAVVNVRMESGRLPGKTLCSLAGVPLLGHLLQRLRRSRKLDQVVVATSIRPSNDPIATFCAEHDVTCFRGAEDDVLGRTLGALRATDAEIGVVVFGDGPLIDPAIVDRMVGLYRDSKGAFDFVGNDLHTTYPAGMEVEAFSVAALADADRRCVDPAIREHGTLYIRQNPGLYRLRSVEAQGSLRRPDLILEVDTQTDLQVIAAILANFGEQGDFELADIIKFLDTHPELARLNQDIPRRWRAFRSDS